MGKEYTEIDASIQRWMSQQKMYFVATAPMSGNGHVNCSPKGLDSLKVMGPQELAYLDVGGSGIETVAHLKENARIVLMMCAFEGPPKIFRFHGRGEVVEPHHPMFAGLLAQFPPQPSARNIIRIRVERISDSCGWGVPYYDFREDRASIANKYATMSDEEIRQYRRTRNVASIDGLNGLEPVAEQ